MSASIDRRRFIGTVGAACVASTVPRVLETCRRDGRRLRRIGLELYSVRNEMKKDPIGTLHQVGAIGYVNVELLWAWDNFGQTTSEVKATLANDGLRAPSAHIAPERLVGDWPRSLETAKTLGHEYLIVPSLPEETNHSLDAWKAWADRFNTAGAVARRAGIWLAFHNEPNHMTPIDGQIPYDVFLARTDSEVVRLQLDTGNMLMGGGDPFAYLQRHADRYWSFHLKDVVADHSHDTELGNGVFDLGRFLAAIPDLDRKPCYVEQEGATDELASARRDYDYLAALTF